MEVETQLGSEVASTETVTTDNGNVQSESEILASQIANSGVVQDEDNEADVSAGEEAKPDEGQTVSETQPDESKAETPEEEKAVANSEKEVSQEDDSEKELTEEDLISLERERMFLKPKVEETIDTVREKLKASSREGHRLAEERKALNEVLSSVGVELVSKTDGSFGLKATENYLTELKDEDVPDIYSRLSPEDQELVEPDVAKKIAKLAMADMVTKAPKTNASQDDVLIPMDKVNSIVGNMIHQKDSQGKSLFPDLGNDEVLTDMRTMYDSEDNTDLRIFANQSEKNMALVLNFLHSATFRAKAPIKAMKAEIEKRRKLANDKSKKEPSTLPSSGGNLPNTQMSNSATELAKQIANA